MKTGLISGSITVDFMEKRFYSFCAELQYQGLYVWQNSINGGVSLLVNGYSKIIIYRKTATASTYLMRALNGVYATTPVSGIDLSANVFNTEYPNAVRYILDNYSDENFTFITTVRDPRTRHLSQFFKNLFNEEIKSPVSGEMIKNPFLTDKKYNLAWCSEVFRKANLEFCCKYDRIIEDSYQELLGLETHFDYQKKYSFSENNRFRLLVIRQEDISLWQGILHKVIGFKITLPGTKVNSMEEKSYAHIYRHFCNNYRFSDYEKEVMAALNTTQSYYRGGS